MSVQTSKSSTKSNGRSPYPAVGQVSHKQFAPTVHSDSRRELARTAKQIVVNADSGNFVYTGKPGCGGRAVNGASRIVAEVLYELFIKAPEVEFDSAVAWTIDTAADLMASSDQLDLGRGRTGTVKASAFQFAVKHFAQSLTKANEQAEKRAAENKAISDERTAAHKAAWEAKRAKKVTDARIARTTKQNAATKAAHEAAKVTRVQERRAGIMAEANHLTYNLRDLLGN